MAHVLLFPSQMKTKAGGGAVGGGGWGACVKSWRDGLSSFSISRLNVFYEPITPDDMLVCVKAGTQRGVKKQKK